jgi:hypothetical protein
MFLFFQGSRNVVEARQGVIFGFRAGLPFTALLFLTNI